MEWSRQTCRFHFFFLNLQHTHTLSSVIHLFYSAIYDRSPLENLQPSQSPIHETPPIPALQYASQPIYNHTARHSLQQRGRKRIRPSSKLILPHFSPKRTSACYAWKPRLRSIWACYRLSEMALARQLYSENRTILIADNRGRLVFSSRKKKGWGKI